jgi:hypothetical protein
MILGLFSITLAQQTPLKKQMVQTLILTEQTVKLWLRYQSFTPEERLVELMLLGQFLPFLYQGLCLHPAFTKERRRDVNFRYYSAYDACVFDVSGSTLHLWLEPMTTTAVSEHAELQWM